MKEKIIVYGTSFITTSLALLFFLIVGFPKVVTFSEVLEITANPIYMISIFIPLGILGGELLWSIIQKKQKGKLVLFFIELFLIAALSFLRYILRIPFSGHALILAYYILYESIKKENLSPLRIIIGIIILGITGFYKIFLWNDWITFVLGIFIGFMIWVISYGITTIVGKKNL
jgi:hypothetical protein